MRFKLYRPKHLRIEGNGLRQKLQDFWDKNRRRISNFAFGAALVASIGSFVPTKAMAAENEMTDTTTPVTNEQVVDYDAQLEADNTVANAVAAAQAVESVPTVQEAPVSQVSEPVVSTYEQEVAPQVEAPAETVQTVETTPTADVQTDEVVTNQETSEEATSNINEEINQRVPEVESFEQASETEEVNTPAINEEIDQRVPQVETSEDAVIDQTTEDAVSQDSIIDNDVTEEVKEDTQTEVSEDKNTNLDYQVIEKDGQLTVVGNISDEQLSQLIEELTQKYGEDVVDGLTAFDYETIASHLQPNSIAPIGTSGYTATMDESGNIFIKDAEGNEIYNWQAEQKTEDVKEEDSVQTPESEGPTFSSDITIPEDYEHRDYEVGEDEYLVIENADGSYTIAMGGVGLSNNQLQDVISKLQKDGVIPADANITADVLPSAPTDEEKNLGITNSVSQIGDFFVETTDGKTYTVYTKDGKVLDTTIKNQDDQLEDNYETSNDSDAEPGNKAGKDDNNPNEPEEPGDKPVEPEPEPEPEPTPEPEQPDVPDGKGDYNPEEPIVEEQVKSALPKTGDSASIAGIVAGLGGVATAAGAALGKKRKKGEDGEEVDDTFEPTYDDMELAAKDWTESENAKAMRNQDYDYDELEAIAEQWQNSKEREEWLQQKQTKGRTR